MISKIFNKLINLHTNELEKQKNPILPESYCKIPCDRIIELIEKHRDFSVLPDAFQLFVYGNYEKKLKLIECLDIFISSLDVSQLVKVDKLFRDRTSIDWNYDWKNEEPQNLLLPEMSDSEKNTILGLCSFHPNGYFREKAIKALLEYKTGRELSYLLIRLNDWVMPVRNCAKVAVIDYLKRNDIKTIVNNLPLIFRLKNCERDEHIDFVQDVIKILSTDEYIEEVKNGLNCVDPKVRICCYEIIVNAKYLNNEAIINYLIKEPIPFIRLSVLRKIQKQITEDELREASLLLMKDKSSPVRGLTLELLYSFNPINCVPILENTILDKSASIRELSRFLLKKHGNYDFASIYRSKIHNNEDLYAAICGVGETGNKDDTISVIRFLKSDNIKIVRATITAISNLDFVNHKQTIIDFLEDNRPGISKQARRVLYKEIDSDDGEKVYEIFKKNNYIHVTINSAILLCALNKWECVSYIVEICSNKAEEISEYGKYALGKWIITFNRSFTSPSTIQMERLITNMKSYGESIDNVNKKFIEAIIKDYN
jgi:hypothetical protein